MNLDHFALSHICDNCPVRVNKLPKALADAQLLAYTFKISIQYFYYCQGKLGDRNHSSGIKLHNK